MLAYETDLLEYDDLFDGSHVVEAKVAELVEGARAEIDRVAGDGRRGRRRRVRLHEVARWSPRTPRGGPRIESGEDVVVGVNRFETTEPNPLTADLDTAIQTVDAEVEAAARRRRPRAGARRATPTRSAGSGPQPRWRAWAPTPAPTPT